MQVFNVSRNRFLYPLTDERKTYFLIGSEARPSNSQMGERFNVNLTLHGEQEGTKIFFKVTNDAQSAVYVKVNEKLTFIARMGEIIAFCFSGGEWVKFL